MTEGTPHGLRAVYHLAVGAEDVARHVEALRYEQSVEVPPGAVRDPFVQKEILPLVESVEPAAGGFRATLAYATATTANDPAQLLNVLFGNCSMLPEVTLVDVELPRSLRDALGGPRHGVSGIRERLGVFGRPLTCSALKPMGLSPEALGDLCRRFAVAGIDVIKDDHGLADHAFCPFEARVEACQRAVELAEQETGHRKLYAPNLIGAPRALAEQLRIARERGVQAVLVAPFLVGLPTLFDLVRAPDGPIVLAHPAFAGTSRIAPAVLHGRLLRAWGADAVIFPHAGGRFAAYDETVCRDLARRLREPAEPLRPALPVAAGGMRVERVEELVSFYGADVMLLVGGQLLEAGPALAERSRAFVERVARAADGLRSPPV